MQHFMQMGIAAMDELDQKFPKANLKSIGDMIQGWNIS